MPVYILMITNRYCDWDKKQDVLEREGGKPMKYYISIEEVRSTVVEVEAETIEQAEEKVEKAYDEDMICLNDIDYIDDGTCFYDETDKWKEAIKNGYEMKFMQIN